jgi:hypothetical protein
MNWTDPAQLAGYVGIACNLWAAILIARTQRASMFQWALCLAGDAAWITFAAWSGQGAALVDVLLFVPVHVVGAVRYGRGVR